MHRHYVGFFDDEEVLKLSSSGGIFSALAKVILDKNGIVFGAAFNTEKKCVEHIGVNSYEDLNLLRKSKYVRSNVSKCFESIKKAIEDNRYILFSGTPCQAYMVRKKFSEYDKLFICDLFCHGTGEQRFFSEYLNEFVPTADYVDFRVETNLSNDNYSIRLYSYGNCILEQPFYENVYMMNMVNSSFYSDSCFQCKYSHEKHWFSDVTMGDYCFESPSVRLPRPIKHPSIFCVNSPNGQILFGEASRYLWYSSLLNENEVMYNYRKHEQLKGIWGYNPELKQKFISDCSKFGFRRAALLSAFPKEVPLIEAALDLKKSRRYLALYGCGYYGKKIKRIIKEYYNTDVDMFLVTDKTSEPDLVDGIPVYCVNEKLDVLSDCAVIIAVAEKYRHEIEMNLRRLKIEENTVIK